MEFFVLIFLLICLILLLRLWILWVRIFMISNILLLIISKLILFQSASLIFFHLIILSSYPFPTTSTDWIDINFHNRYNMTVLNILYKWLIVLVLCLDYLVSCNFTQCLFIKSNFRESNLLFPPISSQFYQLNHQRLLLLKCQVLKLYRKLFCIWLVNW